MARENCSFASSKRKRGLEMSTLLLIILIFILIGVTPLWPYSREWGYTPSGSVGLILVIVLILAVMGRL